MPSAQLVMLDACAVVNLWACRRMAEIVAVVNGRVAVTEVVRDEAQYVLAGGAGPEALEREPVDLVPLITDGALDVIATADEDELLTFVDLTRQLDDGEAMTLAIALHRSGMIVTDDRKAIRVASEIGVPMLTSLDLVKRWSEQALVALPELRRTLGDVRERGRFEPSRQHPLRQWWMEVLAE